MGLNSCKWRFPNNDNGLINGISDSGIETFKGRPIQSLAREICQNSLDARLNPDQPVIVEFKTFSLPSDQIPGFDQLSESVKMAAEYWNHNQKAASFLKKAEKILQKKVISCLRISDFNTTGLLGSSEEVQSPWMNLIKSQGSSDKNGAAGGSYGIGKFAVYAVSELRTVFYSTYDQTGKAAFQGVTRLPSFKNSDGELTQGIGFYGVKKNRPETEQSVMDAEFEKRDGSNFGTDIYVLGFSAHPDWEKQVVTAVLDGFFYAVMKGNLIVKTNKITIDKEALPHLISKYKSGLENTSQYLTVLQQEENSVRKVFQKDIENMGLVELTLMIHPGFNRKTAMVRSTGMKIMDQARISGSIPFSGVLLVKGQELNEYLRKMENPQHTKWEPERAEENITRARNVKREILNFIRSSLREMQEDDLSHAIDPESGSFLSFSQEEASNPSRTEAVSDKVSLITFNPVPVRKTEEVPAGQEEDSISRNGLTGKNSHGEHADVLGGEIPGKHGKKRRGKHRKNSEGSMGEKADTQPKTVDSEKHFKERTPVSVKLRIISVSKAEGKYRIIIHSAQEVKEGELELFFSSESRQTNYKVPLFSACDSSGHPLPFEKNVVRGISLKKDNPAVLTITTEGTEYRSMEGFVYGLQ